MDLIETVYNKYCTKRFPAPAESEILGVERRIGVRLPEDYRAFLAKYNGGIFSEPEITPTIRELS